MLWGYKMKKNISSCPQGTYGLVERGIKQLLSEGLLIIMVIKCCEEGVQGAVEKYMGEKRFWPRLGVKEGFP